MQLLDNPVRPYAWGSRSVIASLLGRPVPSPHPQAELWLGAHPADPSHLVRGGGRRRSLLEEVTEDPESTLGAGRADKWAGRLPFLLKVLAADEPLSLQAHPSAAQAAAGFAREEAIGLAPDAPVRNYRDPNAKPELICALTELHALVGFRDAHCSVQLLRALAFDRLDKLAGHVELLAADPGPNGLRALFTTWITLPQAALDELMPAVQDGCVRLLRDPGGRFRDEARTVLDLSERYPGDAGVLAALLLNRITLAPGEALFLAAGNLHSYQSGAGIELQASSDNVLRGGLTPKHVDVPELLRVLDFSSGPPAVLRGVPDGSWVRYDTPAEEFRLYRLDLVGSLQPPDPVAVPDGGPRILLCTDGAARVSAQVSDQGAELPLCRGQALWLPDSDRGVRVMPAPGITGGNTTERTQLFLACDGL